MDSISLYAALSRMDERKSIQHTQGYEMLRQLSYATQQELADENPAYMVEIEEYWNFFYYEEIITLAQVAGKIILMRMNIWLPAVASI